MLNLSFGAKRKDSKLMDGVNQNVGWNWNLEMKTKAKNLMKNYINCSIV